jgi:hypothetical protein
MKALQDFGVWQTLVPGCTINRTDILPAIPRFLPVWLTDRPRGACFRAVAHRMRSITAAGHLTPDEPGACTAAQVPP